MRIHPVALPEFGVELNWAVCRNPWCPNFLTDVDVDLPDGRKQASTKRYTLKTKADPVRHRVGECTCLYCAQTWQLPSNRAVRPIARYFLGLSLPFADCPNRTCPNHGKNVFEHWSATRSPDRLYRRHRGEHQVRCCACGTSVTLGTPEGARYGAYRLQRRWSEILEGLYIARSVTDTYEQTAMAPSTYYSTLRRLGARLRDYHSFRNARLLHPEGVRRDQPARVYTDVLDVSLQAHRSDRHHDSLRVIVSTMLAERKLFVLAAHPCFMPKRLCPPESVRDEDLVPQPDFEREWLGILHPESALDLKLSGEERQKISNQPGVGGYFLLAPYTEVAHFLVVQKMLSRFDAIHCYMDGAKELAPAALVAMRDRILAGRATVDEGGGARASAAQTAEIVLYQHDKSRAAGRKPQEKTLKQAWSDMDKRLAKEKRRMAKKEAKKPKLLRDSPEDYDGRANAHLYRRAFRGGYSKEGNWAWLRYPPDMEGYLRCRTLWVTRPRGEPRTAHRNAVLSHAKLQPVDSIMNSMRSRISSVARPLVTASGRTHRSNSALPAVVIAEMSVYLLRQNYDLRRKSSGRRIIPARVWGLRTAEEPKLDPLACARDFRLGIEHAAIISGWQRQ